MQVTVIEMLFWESYVTQGICTFILFSTSGFVHYFYLDESISSFRVFLYVVLFYCIFHRNVC